MLEIIKYYLCLKGGLFGGVGCLEGKELVIDGLPAFKEEAAICRLVVMIPAFNEEGVVDKPHHNRSGVY